MPVTSDDRVLIDYRTADDAGVYRLSDDEALVQTVDFFTPIVDDPYVYGQIAAANALSDVYAMGGRPITALAVAAFPSTNFDQEVIRSIFRGGLDKLTEAGVALLGGHTIQDAEVKFGYAVTGLVHPRRVLANAGARPGDVLLLTKAIGSGIITTALKHGRATAAAVDAAVRVMTTLNGPAAEVLNAAPAGQVHACTDVTGFGLLGHATEIAAAGVTLRIEIARVPLLPGARELARRNRTGGGATNQAHFGAGVRGPEELDDDLRALLYDPQTSGGLLVAVAADAADTLCRAFARAGVTVARIGEVLAAQPDVRIALA
jgi:selenide, water dikinase